MALNKTADDFNSREIPSMQSQISHGVNFADDIMPYNSASAQGYDFKIFNPPAMSSFGASHYNGLNSSSKEINSSPISEVDQQNMADQSSASA